MAKKITISAVVWLCSLVGWGQNYDLARLLGSVSGSSEIEHVKVNGNGRIVVKGVFNGAHDLDGTVYRTTGRDVFLATFDNTGKLLWYKSLGFSNVFDGAIDKGAMALDGSGNIYVAGGYIGNQTIEGNTLSNASTTYSEAYLAKYDSLGNLAWIRSLGGGNNDEFITSLTIGPGDTVYAGGYTSSPTLIFNGTTVNTGSVSGNPVAMWLKLNPDGSDNWIQFESNPSACACDAVYAMTYDFSLDRLYLGGVLDDQPMYKAVNAINGTVVWEEVASLVGVPPTGAVRDLLLDGSTITMTGYFTNVINFPGTADISSNGVEDIFVVQLNTSGTAQWAVAFGGSDSDSGEGIITESLNNGFYISGYYRSSDFIAGGTTFPFPDDNTPFILSLTSSGVDIAGTGFASGLVGIGNGTDIAYDNGTVWLAGSYQGTMNFGITSPTQVLPSFFLSSHDPFTLNTNLLVAPPKGEVKGELLERDNNDNLLMAGYVEGTVNISGTEIKSIEITDNYPIVIRRDIFVASFNPAGDLKWAEVINTSTIDSNDDELRDLTVDGQGNVYLSVFLANSTNFGGFNLLAGENLIKIDPLGTVLYAIPVSLPANSRITAIQGDNDPGKESLYVTGTFEASGTIFGNSVVPAGLKDIFIAKLDASGNPVAGAFSTYGDYEEDVFTDLDKLPGSDLFATGYSKSINLDFNGIDVSFPASDSFNILVVSLDTTLFATSAMAQGGSGNQLASKIALDATGSFIISGVIDTQGNLGGTVLDTSPYTSAFVAYYPLNDFYNNQSFATAYFARAIPAVGSNIYFPLNDVAGDNQGNIYAIGTIAQDLNIDGTTYSPAGDSDNLLVSWDSLGNLNFVDLFGGDYAYTGEGYIGFDGGTALAVDSNNNIWLTGLLAVRQASLGTFNLQPASSEEPQAAWGGDTYLARISGQPAVNTTGQDMYWTDASSGFINHANKDGTGAEELYAPSTQPFGVALDTLNGWIYWSNNTGQILRADITATGLANETVIISEAGGGLIMDIELDLVNNLIFWASAWDNTIKQADLSVPDPGTTIAIVAADVITPSGLALDVNNSLVYFCINDDAGGSQDNVARIFQASYDGSTINSLLTSQTAGIDYLFNDIEYDPASGMLYWTGGEAGQVNAGNIHYAPVSDLSGSQTTFATIGEPFGLDLDLPNNQLYWIDRGIMSFQPPRIMRSSLTGAAQDTLLEGAPDFLYLPSFLAIVPGVALGCLVPPTADAGFDITICEGSTATVTGSFTGASTAYWSTSGDGTFNDSTLVNPTYTPGAADVANGSVTLTFTTEDPDGTGPCPAASDQMVITITPDITADAGPDQTVCPGDPVTLAGSLSPSTYSIWSTAGDGTFADTTQISTTYTPGTADVSSGSVILTLTAYDINDLCLPYTDSLVVIISQPIVVASQTDSVRVNETVAIDLKAGATLNPGDSLSLTLTLLTQPQSGTVTVNNDGTLTYTALPGRAGPDSFDVQVCNSCNQCDTATVTVNILNDPPDGTVPADTIMAGQQVVLNVLANIDDPNNNLDPSSLRIVVPPVSGANAYFDSNNNLVVDYSGTSFVGTDSLTIEVCDILGACNQFVIEIIVTAPGVIVYNAVSPNGDGKHDYLLIENAEFFPNNQIRIMNRWGTIVYEVSGYNNSTVVFDGRANRNGSGELPGGTYYYRISLGDENNSVYEGFFVLRR